MEGEQSLSARQATLWRISGAEAQALTPKAAHARLTHFPLWHVERCGFLMVHQPAIACGCVRCVDSSYSLLRSNSHSRPAATEGE